MTAQSISVTDNASSGTVERREWIRRRSRRKEFSRRLPNTDIIFEWFSILYNIIEWLAQPPASTATACCFKSQLFGRSFSADSSFSQSVSFVQKWHFFARIMSRMRDARWKNESICSSGKRMKKRKHYEDGRVLIAENHFNVYINQNQHRFLGSPNPKCRYSLVINWMWWSVVVSGRAKSVCWHLPTVRHRDVYTMHAITTTLLEIVTTQVHGYAGHVISTVVLCTPLRFLRSSSTCIQIDGMDMHSKYSYSYDPNAEQHQDIWRANGRDYFWFLHAYEVTEMRHKSNRIYNEIMDIIIFSCLRRTRGQVINLLRLGLLPRELTFCAFVAWCSGHA